MLNAIKHLAGGEILVFSSQPFEKKHPHLNTNKQL